MSETPAYQRFLAELKRRHVFRVMAVYGAVGFVILQVVELLVPALLLPEWTYRFVALLLIIGFPVAIVLAWAYQTTPEGVKRTDPAQSGELEAIAAQPASRRWPSGLLALVGAAALIGSVWLAGCASSSRARDARLEMSARARTARMGCAATVPVPIPALAVSREPARASRKGMTRSSAPAITRATQMGHVRRRTA